MSQAMDELKAVVSKAVKRLSVLNKIEDMLSDDLFPESKDWIESDAAGRVDFIVDLLNARDKEIHMLEQFILDADLDYEPVRRENAEETKSRIFEATRAVIPGQKDTIDLFCDWHIKELKKYNKELLNSVRYSLHE